MIASLERALHWSVLARAVATGGDAIPELLTELRERNKKIRNLEADLAAARRTPKMVADMLARAETAARTRLIDLRTQLAEDSPERRTVFSELFSDGVVFTQSQDEEGRRCWKVSGAAPLNWVRSGSDPDGI